MRKAVVPRFDDERGRKQTDKTGLDSGGMRDKSPKAVSCAVTKLLEVVETLEVDVMVEFQCREQLSYTKRCRLCTKVTLGDEYHMSWNHDKIDLCKDVNRALAKDAPVRSDT
jgi:hypothetical protein